MYQIYTSFQTYGSLVIYHITQLNMKFTIWISSYPKIHIKQTPLSTLSILNSQYMCPNGSDETFKYYFAIAIWQIQEIRSI